MHRCNTYIYGVTEILSLEKLYDMIYDTLWYVMINGVSCKTYLILQEVNLIFYKIFSFRK